MLDGAQVGAGLQHVRGAGVAEQMRMHGVRDAGSLTGVTAGVVDGVLVEGLAGAHGGGEQPRGRAIPLAIDGESVLQPFGEWDVSRDTTFSLAHLNDPFFWVYVGDLEQAAFV